MTAHFILILLFTLTLSCQTGPSVVTKVPVESSSVKEFKKLEKKFHRSRKKLPNLKALLNFAKKHRNTDLEEKINELIGYYYFESGNYKKAFSYFSKNMKYGPSKTNVNSFLLGAKALIRHGAYDKASSFIKRVLTYPTKSTKISYNLQKLLYISAYHEKDYLTALKAIVRVWEMAQNNKEKESFKIRAIHLVELNLSEDELQTVLSSRDFRMIHDFSAYRLALQHFSSGDLEKSASLFRLLKGISRNDELLSLADEFIEKIKSRKDISPKTIGVILPLSGKHSYVGKRVLNSIKMGMGFYNKKEGAAIQLVVLDNEGSPFKSEGILDKLIKEHRPIAIIGGLFGKTATVIGEYTNAYKIPFFALSQKANITSIGPYVYRSGLVSSVQIRFLVKKAFQKGFRKFAILFPNDPYGIEYANVFWDEVEKQGGEIKGAETYTLKKRSVSQAIERLIGLYYLEDRLQEYEQLVESWYLKTRAFSQRTRPPDDLLPPIVDFDALFIPDTQKSLMQILPALKYHDLKEMTFLGTNAWSFWNELRSKPFKIENSFYIDNAVTQEKTAFHKEYRSIFGSFPDIFCAHGHDIGVVLKTALLQDPSTRDGLLELIRKKRFKGTLGEIYIDESGEFLRPLSIFESKNNLFVSSGPSSLKR